MHALHGVAAREKIVGFYSTGPNIRPADLQIHDLFRQYHANPVLLIIDIRPEVEEIPTKAYITEEVVKEGKETTRTFVHIPSEIGAFEAEEVGVEHLLRDINDPSVSTLAEQVRGLSRAAACGHRAAPHACAAGATQGAGPARPQRPPAAHRGILGAGAGWRAARQQPGAPPHA